MNMIAEVAQSEEERQEQQKIAELKQQGYSYFRVIYRGRLPVTAIKLQGLKAIEPFKATDEQTGEEIWRGRAGSDAYFFKVDSQGRKVTDIWDDPDRYNRFWLSRHTGAEGSDLEVEDKRIAKEIAELTGKPFKAELSEEEELLKQRASIDRKLAKMQKVAKSPEQKPEPLKRTWKPSPSHLAKLKEGRANARAKKQQTAQPQQGVAQGA